MTTPTTQIRQDFDRELEKIRGYADLTEDAKRRRIAEAHERARAEYQEAAQARDREIRERAEKAERALFAPEYPLSATAEDKRQIRAARRSAYNDVYRSVAHSESPAETDEELERLLQRAERTQDPELAEAVYHVATEKGVRKVADAYLEKRPQERRRWEEYVAARQEAESVERLFERAMGARLMQSAEAAE